MANPLLLDIPEAFETDRLLLRAPRAGDGPELNAAVVESFENLLPWMPWADKCPSIEQSEEYSRQAYVRFLNREGLAFRIIDKATGLFVGSSGLHRPDWTVPKFEAGYWCRKRFEGQGYISEALEGLLRFGFRILSARRIEVRCDSLNLRSRRVAERMGMRLEGELRQNCLGHDGTPHNDLVFALTDQDWQTMPRAATSCRIVA